MMMIWLCVFREPTCSAVGVEARSLLVSPSLAAVLPNSRHPAELWDVALGSLGFLENRLLKDDREQLSKHVSESTGRK